MDELCAVTDIGYSPLRSVLFSLCGNRRFRVKFRFGISGVPGWFHWENPSSPNWTFILCKEKSCRVSYLSPSLIGRGARRRDKTCNEPDTRGFLVSCKVGRILFQPVDQLFSIRGIKRTMLTYHPFHRGVPYPGFMLRIRHKNHLPVDPIDPVRHRFDFICTRSSRISEASIVDTTECGKKSGKNYADFRTERQ